MVHFIQIVDFKNVTELDSNMGYMVVPVFVALMMSFQAMGMFSIAMRYATSDTSSRINNNNLLHFCIKVQWAHFQFCSSNQFITKFTVGQFLGVL